MRAQPDFAIRGFFPPAALFARTASVLRPPRRLTVAQCAAEYRILDNPGGGYSGPWENERAPWLLRPMETLTDYRYSMTAIMGPAQSGKSEVGNNWLLYCAVEDPGNIVWCQSDKNTMGSYVREKIDPMISLSDTLRARQLDTASADNLYLKQFLGMHVDFIWPVPAAFRFRSAPRFVLDDYDEIPDDIGGQGSPLRLLGGRQTTFEGSEKGLLISSPAKGISRGIEREVAAGTDERFFWKCPHCAEWFSPDFERDCRYDRSGTKELAGQTVEFVAPCCGCVIAPRDKPALNRNGRWAGPEQRILADGTVEGPLRDVRTASFRFNGVFTFASWAKLAEEMRAAELAFEERQDEAELVAVVNTRIGKNYKSRVSGAEPVATSMLEARAAASEYTQGTAPAGCRFLTAAVDVQGNRFEVAIWGWGEGFESYLVARYPIIALDDGITAIDPANRPEHWSVILRKVVWTRWPVAGDPEFSLPVLCTAIDTGGSDGVTNNAFSFWHKAHGLGVPATALTLVKGGNQPKGRLLPPPTTDAKRQMKGADQVELFVPNVNRFKSIIDNRLRREQPGPGHVHFPRDIDPKYLAELTAEERTDGVWIKLDGRRNETLDLAVYGLVPIVRLGGNDASFGWVPGWARPSKRPAEVPDMPAAATAVPTDTAQDVANTGTALAAALEALAEPPAPVARPRRQPRLRVNRRF